jgi:MerR family redox-sensitive transcriptional activator SoxR
LGGAVELMSISDVGRATGLQSSALRYYEREGLISSHARVGGRRHYDPRVLHRLAVISLLQEAGFTIGEISDLVSGRNRAARWRELAADKLTEIDRHLERVNAARKLLTTALSCECGRLETCELVRERRGPHRKVAGALTLGFRKEA